MPHVKFLEPFKPADKIIFDAFFFLFYIPETDIWSFVDGFHHVGGLSSEMGVMMKIFTRLLVFTLLKLKFDSLGFSIEKGPSRCPQMCELQKELVGSNIKGVDLKNMHHLVGLSGGQ